jgi:hypothetical protein
MLIQDHRQVMILELASSASRPRRRGAAYSIWAADKTLTMAATVACNLAGATTVGFGGHSIMIVNN